MFPVPFLNRGIFVDVNAQIYFDAVAATGTALTGAQQALINAFFIGMKADGLYTKTDGGNILCLTTAAQCYIDWKVPARVATVDAAPTFTFTTKQGFAGSGASAGVNTDYIQNGYIPWTGGGVWLQDSMHMFAMAHTAAASSGFEIGCNGTNDTYIRFRSADLMICRSNNGANLPTVANTDGSGFLGITRTASNDTRYWREGAQLGATQTTVSAGLPDVAVRILQPLALTGTTRQLSYAGFGGGLTPAEVALYTTRVQTLTTGLRAL